MNSTTRFYKFIVAGSLCLASAGVLAAGSVVESQAVIPGQGSSYSVNVAGAAGSNNDAMVLLMDQISNLRTEVQTLRAMVEEQGYELRRLQRESLDRYTNIDSRLSSLEQTPASSAGVTSPTAVAPSQGTVSGPDSLTSSSGNDGASRQSSAIIDNTAAPPAVSSTPVNNTPNIPSQLSRVTPDRPTLEPAVLSEQQLYQMAYDSVINSEFDRAIAEFDQYLNSYPAGRFLANAHYWKGQAYLYLSRYNEAIESYNLILQTFSDSPKVPDAMYGLGLAYEGMGNTAQARRILQDIMRSYPNTGVANLADTRLRSLN